MSNPFEPPQSPHSPPKSRPLLWMALISAVLFLLGIVAFQYLRLQQKTAMINEIRAQEQLSRQQAELAVERAQQAVEQSLQAAESARVQRQQKTSK